MQYATDLQVIPAVAIEHPIVTPVDPAPDLGSGLDQTTHARLSCQQIQRFAQAGHEVASLIVAELFCGVLVDLVEVYGGFGAQGESPARRLAETLGGNAQLSGSCLDFRLPSIRSCHC